MPYERKNNSTAASTPKKIAKKKYNVREATTSRKEEPYTPIYVIILIDHKVQHKT